MKCNCLVVEHAAHVLGACEVVAHVIYGKHRYRPKPNVGPTRRHTLRRCASAQLLAEGELAPGLSAAEFADRRARLARLLPPGGVAVVPGAAKTYRTGAIPYPYRQVRSCLCSAATAHVAPAALTSGPRRRMQTSCTSPESASRPSQLSQRRHRPTVRGTRSSCPTPVWSASAGTAPASTARQPCVCLAPTRRTLCQRWFPLAHSVGLTPERRCSWKVACTCTEESSALKSLQSCRSLKHGSAALTRMAAAALTRNHEAFACGRKCTHAGQPAGAFGDACAYAHPSPFRLSSMGVSLVKHGSSSFDVQSIVATKGMQFFLAKSIGWQALLQQAHAQTWRME